MNCESANEFYVCLFVCLWLMAAKGEGIKCDILNVFMIAVRWPTVQGRQRYQIADYRVRHRHNTHLRLRWFRQKKMERRQGQNEVEIDFLTLFIFDILLRDAFDRSGGMANALHCDECIDLIPAADNAPTNAVDKE